MQARFQLIELSEGYKWQPEVLKGKGTSEEPFDLDPDEDMPQVKVELEYKVSGIPRCESCGLGICSTLEIAPRRDLECVNKCGHGNSTISGNENECPICPL